MHLLPTPTRMQKAPSHCRLLVPHLLLPLCFVFFFFFFFPLVSPFVKGAGTDEETIAEILASRSNEEVCLFSCFGWLLGCICGGLLSLGCRADPDDVLMLLLPASWFTRNRRLPPSVRPFKRSTTAILRKTLSLRRVGT